MTRALRVRPEAEEELLEAAEWYESRKPGLGVDLVATVDEAFDRIVEAPLACPMWRSGLPHRFHTLRRFPFVVFFVFDDSSVEIVAIAHGRRGPGYWRLR